MATAAAPSISIPNTLSIAETCDVTGLSRDTIRRRIADGSLRGYKVGPRMIRVHADDVAALLRPIPSAGGGRIA